MTVSYLKMGETWTQRQTYTQDVLNMKMKAEVYKANECQRWPANHQELGNREQISLTSLKRNKPR
jgi:hypothetical protein